MPRIWLLPALILTTILGLTAVDVLSRSLVLDLVAWWPVWLGLLMVVVLFGGRRIGRLKVGALASVLVTAALVVFIVGHVGGWPLNPSSTRYLVGPDVSGVARAELTAVVRGELRVSAGSLFLYEVDPLGRGGRVGIPTAVERSLENTTSVVLEEPSNPGFDTSAGWNLRLSAEPSWTLTLGGDADLDLTALKIDELVVNGSGLIRLGPVEGAVPVDVQGAFSIEVVEGVSVRVAGDAQVPPSWNETSDGWRSPEEGVGWMITVPPGSVVSIDQG